MGLYIFPRYEMKTTNAPAVRAESKTMRAPNQSTMLVPTATMISTIGESFAFRPRARKASSTLSRLSSSRRCCSYSSRPNAFTTRIEVSTSWITENNLPFLLSTSRAACLIRRV